MPLTPAENLIKFRKIKKGVKENPALILFKTEERIRLDLEQAIDNHFASIKTKNDALMEETKKEALQAVLTQFEASKANFKGDKGDTPKVDIHFKQPKDGKSADEENIIKRLFKKIRKPKDGVSPDPNDVAKIAATLIPKQKTHKPETIEKIVLNLNLLENVLGMHVVQGLREELRNLKKKIEDIQQGNRMLSGRTTLQVN